MNSEANAPITQHTMAKVKNAHRAEGDALEPPGRVIGEEQVVEPELSDDGAVHLCRCGHSKNKPFCDSSHREAAE